MNRTLFFAQTCFNLKKISALLIGLSIASSSFASPATPATIEKYLEAMKSKAFFEKSYQIKKEYYDDLAEKRVLYFINASTLDPRVLTPKQKLAANKISQIYQQSDPSFRTPEQEYQHQSKLIGKYYSEESLQYFIKHSKTEAEQELITKSNLVNLFFTFDSPQLVTRYLDQKHFNRIVFEDILKLSSKTSGITSP